MAVQEIAASRVQKRRRWSLETSFLGIGFLFGLAFLLITPPFQVADESRHFVRAYAISERVLYELGFVRSHTQLPRSLVEAIRETEYLRFDPEAKATVSHTLARLADKLNPDQRAGYAETATYPFISYLPQIALIIPFRLLHVNAVVTLYAARFCALLFWLAVTYLAVRKLPIARHLLFFIALLPMTLFQAGSLSADCVTLSLSFLLVAYYIQLAYRAKPVGTRELLIAGGLGVLLTAAKMAYAPLIGLHFLIRPAKFSSRRGYLLSLALTAFLCLATLWLSYTDYLATLLSPQPTTVSQAATGLTRYPELNFLLESPLNLAQTMLTTGKKFGRVYMDGFVGILGWSSASLPSYLYVVTVLMLWLTAFATDSRQVIRPIHKLMMVGISVLIAITICLVISTDTLLNNKPTYLLLGIQGRYFTPIALLIGLLAVNRSELTRRYGQYVHAAVLPFVIFLLLNAVYFLVDHYYVL